MAEVIGSSSGGAAAPPPPLPDLPNLDQVAQMVNADSPEVFYQQATWFDQVKQTLADVNDGFRREAKGLDELWHGDSAGAYGGEVGRVAGMIDQLRAGPDYAGLLRRAGDALASAQQRVRDLQAQKAAQPDVDPTVFDEQARQIAIDLATAYGDVGSAFGQGPELEGVTNNGQVAPPPFSGAGQETGGGAGNQGLGVRGGSGTAAAVDPGTGAGSFTVGGGGSGAGGAPAAVLGRTPGSGRAGMFGFGGDGASSSGTNWGEPQLTDSGVITGTSGSGALGSGSALGGGSGAGTGRGSASSGRFGGKAYGMRASGTGNSDEDESQDTLLGFGQNAAPSTALGKPVKRSLPVSEVGSEELTSPAKKTVTADQVDSTGQSAKLQRLDTARQTTSQVQSLDTQSLDTVDKSVQSLSASGSAHATAATAQSASSGSQAASGGSQSSGSGSPAANSASHTANSTPAPASTGASTAHAGADKPAAKIVAETAVGGASSVPKVPAIPVASAVPTPAVAMGPNPATEMHLTIPAQASGPASAGMPMHGPVPPLPVRTVGALSASGSEPVLPAGGAGSPAHGGSSGSATTQGGGAPMMPMGAGGVPPRAGHHVSSVQVPADPDAWIAVTEAPLAVLGRPIRGPEPPPGPISIPIPVPGSAIPREGDKNG